MFIEAAVFRHPRQGAADADLFARHGRQNSERQQAVRFLKRTHILPVLFDHIHLAEEEQGVAELMAVQRRIAVAIAKALAVGAH